MVGLVGLVRLGWFGWVSGLHSWSDMVGPA